MHQHNHCTLQRRWTRVWIHVRPLLAESLIHHSMATHPYAPGIQYVYRNERQLFVRTRPPATASWGFSLRPLEIQSPAIPASKHRQ